jgi:hypothetical protein
MLSLILWGGGAPTYNFFHVCFLFRSPSNTSIERKKSKCVHLGTGDRALVCVSRMIAQ